MRLSLYHLIFPNPLVNDQEELIFQSFIVPKMQTDCIKDYILEYQDSTGDLFHTLFGQGIETQLLN